MVFFRHKFRSNRYLSRYKARLVVCGFSQEHGIDYNETCRHIVKSSTIHIILSLAQSLSIGLFINSMSKTFYFTVISPIQFILNSPLVFKLHLIPLQSCPREQDPRSWCYRFATFATSIGVVVHW
jgi:hypothetical protein